ncbi:glycosyltransferase [Pseudomonas sp. LjRoot71]|uniref:glycosyltransferase n=1 Tax=Pseudomonas sp. LjRoot71 TaxID=3342336 RepID=UPI003ECCF961
MKILLLSNMYPSDSHVFYGIFVKNFFNAMTEEGADITKTVIAGRGIGLFNKCYKYTRYFLESFRAILKNDYDIIYVHSSGLALLPATILRKLIKKPLVVNIHGGDIMDRSPLNDIVFKLNSSTIVKSSLVVIPSHNFRNTVLAKIKLSKTRIFISPSGGIDRSIFKPIENKKRYDRTLHIGYISRIDPDKGWDTFISALNLLRNNSPSLDVKATIVGKGSELEAMRSMIESLKLNNIIHIEQLNQNQLPSIYTNFDLFIFPSRRQSESLGLVGLEAMSCGIPVIASKIGGIQDYIEHGANGFSFEPGNHEELAKIIMGYSSLPSTSREALRLGAIATAEKYDSKKVSNSLFNRLKSIVNENATAKY